MPVIDRSKYRNPSPPDSEKNYDNNARVTLRLIPLDALDDDLQQLLILYEDELKSPPNSDESAEWSLSDDDSKEPIELLPKNVTEKQGSNSTSVESHQPQTSLRASPEPIEIDTLSDGEIPSEKESPKKEVVKKKELKRYSPKRTNKLGINYTDSEESDREPEPMIKPKHERRFMKLEPEPEIEEKQIPGISVSLSDYYCEVCNIALNSEATLQTHLIGRRHKKALNAQNVTAVAYESLSHMAEQSKLPYNYPIPPPKMKHIKVQERPKLQRAIDDYKSGPLPGLKYVTEIHCGSETKYYCNLCHSPCSTSSIMQHLVGKTHRQHMCDVLDEKYKYRTRYGKETPERQTQILLDYERRHGREKMRVEIEVRDDSPDRELFSSRSTRNYDDSLPSTSKGPGESKFSSNVHPAIEDLDTSRNDFYCTVCDSHMNNQSMWESHIRGKRHMKNKKKIPGEAASKLKSICCPGEIAHLMLDLEDVEEPVVGLDYIRETQGPAGDFYNCFLCGACVTNYDIIDHLVSVKHQTKYLETANKKGQANAIENIKLCYELPPFQRSALIREECEKLLVKYGPGNVHVYRSKDILKHF